MKKVLPLAIAAALAVPAAAMADATVYGKLRTSIDSVDDGNDTIIEINSHASRLGVKGSEDLGDGLKAIYQIEGQVNFADQVNEFGTATSLFTGRNTFVGLAGGFGTALIGRHDTPMKMSTGKLDYFKDTQADFNKSYMGDFSDRRADGTVAYVSPNWAGLTLAAALVPGENTEANGIADAYSLAAMYENGGLFLSGAYEAGDGNIDAIGVDGEDLSQWRVGGGYDSGVFRVAAVYESETVDNWFGPNDDLEVNKWAVSGGFTLGMGEIKASYQTWDEDFTDWDNEAWVVGYDYNLSKRTQLYALYLDSNTDYNTVGVSDDEMNIFSIGLNHSF